jgi:hypothetical protein
VLPSAVINLHVNIIWFLFGKHNNYNICSNMLHSSFYSMLTLHIAKRTSELAVTFF